MHDHTLLALAAVSFAASFVTAQTTPRVQKIPHETTIHGVTLQDEYFWLRQRNDPVLGPKVIEHLKAERAYCDAAMAHTSERQRVLYDEMVARVQQTDTSVPYRMGKWSYYTRNVEGKPYKIYCRKPLPDGEEQIILDANKAAEGQRNFRVGGMEISPDARVAAFAIDLNGAEKYEIRFRDLAANADLSYTIPDTAGEIAWASDSRTVFYTTLDQTMRPYRVHRHSIGADPATDAIVYEEKDDQFFVSIETTRSGRFVMIQLESRDTTEWRFIPAANPRVTPVVIEPREKGHEYKVEHHEGRFLILTNDGAKNFRLVEAPTEAPGRENWREIRAGRPDVLMERVLAFKNHFVLAYRQNAMPHLSITAFRGVTKEIETSEPSYVIFPEMNEEYDTDTFRYSYTSPITPMSVYAVQMDSAEKTLLKQQPVIGYDPSLYTVEFVQAVATDGTPIPLTITYKKDTPRDGTAPALLEGYSAYGLSAIPNFWSHAVSLLDRGFVLAEAHCRGGSDMGRSWYDDGKLMKKRNTFTDFIACAEYLVEKKYTNPPRLAIRRGSAGGLLMGAVTTMRPDLFGAVIAHVPFVDTLNTMLDPTLPLTINEYDEWGNPTASKEAFDYIRSYSPYDNTRPARYPHILLTSGINDPRVSYFEPAKWALRLRDNNQADTQVLFKIELDAGHGSFADRYAAMKDEAFVQAFVLDRLGVAEPDVKKQKKK